MQGLRHLDMLLAARDHYMLHVVYWLEIGGVFIKFLSYNIYLEVPFRGESLLADGAPERLVASVRAHVDLKS